MQDRPTADELLAAVEGFLRDDVMPSVGSALSFHARVAANVLALVRREQSLAEVHVNAELDGLDKLVGPATPPDSRVAARESLAERNEELCNRIRRGDADDGEYRRLVLRHLRSTIRDKLLVSNPRWVGD